MVQNNKIKIILEEKLDISPPFFYAQFRSMATLRLSLPENIIFGLDTLEELPRLVKQKGNRTIVVVEAVSQEEGYVATIQSLLSQNDIAAIIYDEVNTKSSSSTIEDISKLIYTSKSQVVIGLGGMKLLSLARCAAAIGGKPELIGALLQGKEIPASNCSFIEIPSSFRNHFMFRKDVIIKNTVNQYPIKINLNNNPSFAVILDPKLSMGLSPKYYALALMDTLLAAVEGYISGYSSFLSEVYFSKSLESLVKSLRTAINHSEDIRYRVRSAEAGMTCAMGLTLTGQGLGGAIAYGINSSFDVPKSWVATILTPYLLELYAGIEPEKIAYLADLLGEDVESLDSEQAAKLAAKAIRRLIGQLGLPSRLRDCNLNLDHLLEASSVIANMEMLYHTPRQFTLQEIQDLLRRAF